MFHTQFVDVVMLYVQTVFHKPNFNGLTVMAILPLAKYKIREATMLLFIIQRNYLIRSWL